MAFLHLYEHIGTLRTKCGKGRNRPTLHYYFSQKTHFLALDLYEGLHATYPRAYCGIHLARVRLA